MYKRRSLLESFQTTLQKVCLRPSLSYPKCGETTICIDLSLLLKAYSLLYSCCSNIKSLCIKTMSSLSSLRKVVNGGTKLKNQQPLEVNKIEMTEPWLFYEFFLYSMRWLLITFFISILKAQIWWHQYKIFSGSKRVRSVIHLRETIDMSEKLAE